MARSIERAMRAYMISLPNTIRGLVRSYGHGKNI